MIVEYKLHRNQQGNKIIPFFIIDGGYFVDGNKLVGIAVNDGSYIPETLVVLDRAALITRLTNLGYKIFNTETNEDVLATAEEIETIVDTWISEHDL
jgi:hypothetical protein|tara:strand:+ start:1933 stop:2223 length:291 start_codon:yes stop_codon:yes gene_type:complete